jgi:DNA-binding transcriptional regulator LsrR (DeoR family)
VNDIDDHKILYKILRLYFIDNFNQREIAEILNLSRIKVNRYINYARKNNLIEIHLNIPPHGNAPQEIAIEQNFGLNECRIVDDLVGIHRIMDN